MAARRHQDRAHELQQRAADEPRHVAGERLMPPDPPSPGGTIKVTPADLATSAKYFYSAQQNLSNAWQTLLTSLDANAGFAGDDDPAKSFDAKYEPAVQAAWKALRSAT